MSRIQQAIHGSNDKTIEFLKSEGFGYNEYASPPWQYKTEDANGQPIEVELYSSYLRATIYNSNGSGKIVVSDTFDFGSEKTFEEAYEEMLEFFKNQ